MKRLFLFFLGSLTLLSYQFAYAGDIASGKKKSAVCVSCHGVNGKATVPIYPNLAGQNDGYLISAMKAYRDRQRNGGMAVLMQVQAARLSDTDIEDLAAYFYSLKCDRVCN